MGFIVAALLIIVGIFSIKIGLRFIELSEKIDQRKNNLKNDLKDERRIIK